MTTNQPIKEGRKLKQYNSLIHKLMNEPKHPPVKPPPQPQKPPITDPPIPPSPDDHPSKDPGPIGDPPSPIQPVILEQTYCSTKSWIQYSNPWWLSR